MGRDVLDVAVVGAGVSGVYCAWRLLSTGAAERVSVFEGSERVGGRLLSATPPGMPDLRAELGGMRILKGVQTRIANLVAVLGIETYPFPVTDPEDLLYLRGVHLRESDFADRGWDVPYRLGLHEKSKTAGEIVVDAIEQIVPGITTMDDARRREVVKDATFDGRPLYQQGFWQVLCRVMSSEAFDLAVAAGGYQSTLCSWNAADAIPWYLTDFSIEAEYHGFVRGFETVPCRIAEEVSEHPGGSIELSRRLEAVDRADDGVMELQFADGEVVRARAVILAMPRRSLELLDPRGCVFGRPEVAALLRTVTPRPLLKLFAAYRSPWWRAAGVRSGRSVTDLPVRQVYYWPNHDGSARRRGNALLMASYDDGRNVGFWEGLRYHRSPAHDEVPAEAGLEPFVGARMPQAAQAEAWDAHRAPRVMVEEIGRQLQELHGLRFVPQPYAAAFKDWGADPFGGGWNTWNVGVRSWEVERAVQRPVDDVPLYICGEAYSREQGWVEGALDTADQVLARYFNVAGLV